MLVDADGSPHGHTVYSYTAGEVYSPESNPPATGYLMAAFVSSGRAVEVDEQGNPVGTPATRRGRKSAASEEPEAESAAAESSDTSEPVAEPDAAAEGLTESEPAAPEE